MESGVFHTTYQQDTALRRTPAQKVRLVVLLAFLVIFPFLADNYYLTLANQIAIAAVGAIGLNILVGFTGQISIGHAAFFGFGAFASAWISNHGIPVFFAIPLAGVMTTAVGMLFGLPAARLKGLYLAIAT